MINENLLSIYRTRVMKFYGLLYEACWGESRQLNADISISPEPVPFADRPLKGDRILQEGEIWGKLWDCAWLHIEDEIPEEWKRKTLALRLNLGGEAQIFSSDGMPLNSFTNTSYFVSQYRKENYLLSREEIQKGRLDLWLELGANGLTGDELNPDIVGNGNEIGLVRHLKLAEFFPEVWHLRLEFEVLLGLLNMISLNGHFVFLSSAIPGNSHRYIRLLSVLNRAVDVYAGNPSNASLARKIIAPELARPASTSSMTVTAVGHAHIDTGWLWPVRESVRKCARTFGHQLQLMKKYPEYVFGASQAQHYEFIKKYYPLLFNEIKKRVKEGRWELQGGMWVESDINIPCGESLIRQFLYGKNFFRKEFGIEVKNLWLPDVFGFSASLPQIIRKSGCDVFMTQKICGNQLNRFPYHAFTWHGIDDSQVLSFFIPENTYNSMLLPNQLNFGCDNLTENYLLDESLTLFGIGDGGGGPKEEFIERGLYCRNLEGCPKVRFGRADQFFERLEKKQPILPHWHGELYFELHRGTLTTQAKNKRFNRRAEQLLIETEFLASLLPAVRWPRDKFDFLWKKLLLNQFHDILPGSSIHRVYDVTDREYTEMFQFLQTMRAEIFGSLCSSDGNSLTLFNTLPYDYTRLVKLPVEWKNAAITLDGCPLQNEAGFTFVPLNANSIVTLCRSGNLKEKRIVEKKEKILENNLIRYAFDEDGRLQSAYDKEMKREMLASSGNDFSLYHDAPNHYNAWDIDIFYSGECVAKAELVKISSLEVTSLRQVLNLQYRIGNSDIRQEISLETNSKRLEFHTWVRWQEDSKMLRVAFPTSIVTDKASCEIQNGYIARPTHRNTSWDQAKFEVVAHRYVDLSENDCGVALLNDCKYGHGILNGTIDLNLLRSPIWPDPEADRGEHEFTYAFFPHTGNLNESQVMAEAAMLNRPCPVHMGKYTGPVFPCRIVQADRNVNWEILKRAEDSEGFIIRLIDESGLGGNIVLEFRDECRVEETDLMEWRSQQTFDCQDRQFLKLHLGAFEIKTLCLS